jgi:hypothetical protein
MKLSSRVEKLEARLMAPAADKRTIIFRIVEPGPTGPRLVKSLRREPDGLLVELAA